MVDGGCGSPVALTALDKRALMEQVLREEQDRPGPRLRPDPPHSTAARQWPRAQHAQRVRSGMWSEPQTWDTS